MTENKNENKEQGIVRAVDEPARAVLVAIITDKDKIEQCNEYLDELEFLALTADYVTVKRFTQRMATPNSRIYIGPGKLEEIAIYCKEHEVDTVIFDDELSPVQIRNIETVHA